MPLIYSPSSSPLPNDFLLPLASFPLSSSALHKSTRSLDPSKANEHHPFPPPLSLSLFFLPARLLSLASACRYWCAHIEYVHTVHATLPPHIFICHILILNLMGYTDDKLLIISLCNFLLCCNWATNTREDDLKIFCKLEMPSFYHCVVFR